MESLKKLLEDEKISIGNLENEELDDDFHSAYEKYLAVQEVPSESPVDKTHEELVNIKGEVDEKVNKSLFYISVMLNNYSEYERKHIEMLKNALSPTEIDLSSSEDLEVHIEKQKLKLEMLRHDASLMSKCFSQLMDKNILMVNEVWKKKEIFKKRVTSISQGRNIKIISDLKEDEYATVICQVCAVYKMHTSIKLKCHDGSASGLLRSKMCDPEKKWLKDEALLQSVQGFIFDVYVSGTYCDALKNVKPRDFLKISDGHLLHSKYTPGKYQMQIHPQSAVGRGIEILDKEDNALLPLKSRLRSAFEKVGVEEERIISFLEDDFQDLNQVTSSCSDDSDVSEGMPEESVEKMEQQEKKRKLK